MKVPHPILIVPPFHWESTPVHRESVPFNSEKCANRDASIVHNNAPFFAAPPTFQNVLTFLFASLLFVNINVYCDVIYDLEGFGYAGC